MTVEQSGPAVCNDSNKTEDNPCGERRFNLSRIAEAEGMANYIRLIFAFSARLCNPTCTVRCANASQAHES